MVLIATFVLFFPRRNPNPSCLHTKAIMKLRIFFVALLLSSIAPARSQCTFCLSFCKQPPFPGNIFSSDVILSVKAKVLSNSTTVCTGVCDGKGVALGNRKTVYEILVKRILKGTAPSSNIIKVAGIFTFASALPGRRGINMDVGKIYFINLLAPLNLPGINQFKYIDRCDHPFLWPF